MSMSSETIVLPPSVSTRTAAGRLGDLPMIPIIILAVIAFMAIFADVLAPHNPEVGALTARFKPPFWQAGGTMDHILGTDQLGRDAVAPIFAPGSRWWSAHRGDIRRCRRHRSGILAGYLAAGPTGDHAYHRRVRCRR
jgi:hypothetical protein